MKIIIGIMSAISTVYMLFTLMIENFAYQAGAISETDWNYKLIITVLLLLLSVISLQEKSKKGIDKQTIQLL